MRKAKKLTAILIVLMAVGFAAVSTTLNLNGNITIGTDASDFTKGIVFDKDSITNTPKTTALLSESGRTITFTTQIMKTISEEATVYFKIRNNSQYHVTFESPAIKCYFVDEYAEDIESANKTETNDYIYINVGHEIDSKTVPAGGGLSDQTSITIRQIKSYNGTKNNYDSDGDGVDDALQIKYQCVIKANATESTSQSIVKEQDPIIPNTYSLSGYLVDENNQSLPNKYLVVYSETPKYAKTDSKGYFYVSGLEDETHEIYILNESGEGKSKSEVVSSSISSSSFVVRDISISLTNNYSITSTKIAKPSNQKYLVTVDYGDELNVETREFRINDKYNLGEPTRHGYIFVGWFIGEKEIRDGDYITSDDKVIAKWQSAQSSDIYYDNSKTGLDCNTVECALKELSKMGL